MEKSPLDILTEVHTMLSDLTSRITLLEQNMALLHDKANGKLFPAPPTPSSRPSDAKLITVSSNIMNELEAGQKIVGVPQSKPSGARVHGKVNSPDQKPVNQASITIKNQKHDTVAQLKTGPDGVWEKQLPIGKYALTYSKGGMSSTYRFIDVKPDQFDIEVL